jgi:hypothetical protein
MAATLGPLLRLRSTCYWEVVSTPLASQPLQPMLQVSSVITELMSGDNFAFCMTPLEGGRNRGIRFNFGAAAL